MGNWLLWFIPALQLQGEHGDWQTGWQAARLLQLTASSTPSSLIPAQPSLGLSDSTALSPSTV